MLGRGRGRGRDLGRDGGGLISKGVKALAGGVGLASESIKTYKENKAQEKANAGNNSQLMQGSAGDETGQDALTASSSKDPPPSYSSVPGVQTSVSQVPIEITQSLSQSRLRVPQPPPTWQPFLKMTR